MLAALYLSPPFLAPVGVAFRPIKRARSVLMGPASTHTRRADADRERERARGREGRGSNTFDLAGRLADSGSARGAALAPVGAWID